MVVKSWEAGLKGVSASKTLGDFERGQEKSFKIYPKVSTENQYSLGYAVLLFNDNSIII